jgi:hypothetical protein
MGFLVKQPVETFEGNHLEEFYIRIEHYQLDKLRGTIGVSFAHYESTEAANANFPKYLEDAPNPYGRVATTMTYKGETKEYPMWYSFNIHTPEVIVEHYPVSKWHSEMVDYIDFDEDGNEIVKQKEEWFETITTETKEITKTLLDIGSITGSIYDFCYSKLKEVYSEMFGSENIIDIL